MINLKADTESKFVLAVVNQIFGDELKNYSISNSKHSNRTPMPNNIVDLIKSNLQYYVYQYFIINSTF